MIFSERERRLGWCLIQSDVCIQLNLLDAGLVSWWTCCCGLDHSSGDSSVKYRLSVPPPVILVPNLYYQWVAIFRNIFWMSHITGAPGDKLCFSLAVDFISLPIEYLLLLFQGTCQYQCSTTTDLLEIHLGSVLSSLQPFPLLTKIAKPQIGLILNNRVYLGASLLSAPTHPHNHMMMHRSPCHPIPTPLSLLHAVWMLTAGSLCSHNNFIYLLWKSFSPLLDLPAPLTHFFFFFYIYFCMALSWYHLSWFNLVIPRIGLTLWLYVTSHVGIYEE